MTPQQLQQLLQQATTYTKSGDHIAALSAYRSALNVAPDNPDLLFAAGNAARHCRHFEEAADYFKNASEQRPTFFAALCNLGASLKELRRFDEAIPPLEQAMQLRPEIPALSLQLADCYLTTRRSNEARSLLESALQTAPENAELLCSLGNCAMEQKQFTEAKSYYHRALQLRPDYGDVHYNLGTIMREWNRLDEAVTCFRNAVRFKPGTTAPLVDLGETLQLLGAVDESETMLRQALAHDPNCTLACDNLLVTMKYNPRHSRKEVESAHQDYCSHLVEQTKTTLPQWANRREADRKLTIGYLSPDFCNHPAASFLEPVLRHHRRDRFTINCYSQTIHNDRRTEVFKSYAENWYPIEHLDDDAATSLIRKHGVDILVDTAGHLHGNRYGIFTRRAAPVQIGGIGYPGLRGGTTIDGRISDSILDPPSEATGSSELPLRIDPCFCCWQPPEKLPQVSPLPAQRNGFVTFGSLHTTARLNASVIALWSRVLKAIPTARLLICRTTLVASVVDRLSGWFKENGIDPIRITFLDTIPPEGHLSVYHRIDITLDTHPWSGHTTACESMIMGVPVLTLLGDRPAGRMVASVLSAVDLETFITTSPEMFTARASDLAATPETLAAVRARLREQLLSSPLCNANAYTIALENRFRKLWIRWCTAPR